MSAEVPPATLPGTPKVIHLCRVQLSPETSELDARIVLLNTRIASFLKACIVPAGVVLAAELLHRRGKADQHGKACV